METINRDIRRSSFTTKKRDDALPPPPPRAICDALKVEEITIEWLAGDGSDRCYYRLSSPQLVRTYVLMQLSEKDAKALRENGYEWIQIGQILNRVDIFVPKTVATLPKYAAIIIEDYGNTMMESQAMELLVEDRLPELATLYEKALQILDHFLNLKGTSEDCWTKRSFDAERLQWELNFFQKEFLMPVGNIHLSAEDQIRFTEDSKKLSEFLAKHSRYFVHRDFHSRNLMVKDTNLAVIDFQDARYGPPSYDLVSLCFDSYIPMSMEFRQDLIRSFARMVGKKVAEEIELTWRPMLLQRQLKAIGSFGYLSIKKNRGNYLKYLKPALETLAKEVVGDKRWPFLSKVLIERIRNNIG